MWCDVTREQWIGSSFAEQGLGIEEVLFELGLVNEAFYDTIAPAESGHIAALESWWGRPLPADYRAFLELAGGSLGMLRIQDWRRPWEFRPDRLLRHVATRDDAPQLRADGLLPVALLGECTDLGYDDEACLLLDVATGDLSPEDSGRSDYEDLSGLLLEWGHRVLDPLMATSIGHRRVYRATGLAPATIARVHAIATAAQAPDRSSFLGRGLGVYRYRRSGVLVRTTGPNEIVLEAYRAARTAPDRTAAAAVLEQARALAGR